MAENQQKANKTTLNNRLLDGVLFTVISYHCTQNNQQNKEQVYRSIPLSPAGWGGFMKARFFQKQSTKKTSLSTSYKRNNRRKTKRDECRSTNGEKKQHITQKHPNRVDSCKKLSTK